MNTIPLVGFDPALANWGTARVLLDIDTMELEIESLVLTVTDKLASKQVRKNSDDLRRAQEIRGAMALGCTDRMYAFAEIPSGAQDANASRAFGIAVGVMASCPIPLIQVQNFEAKLAAVGTKTASKQEMIEWATEKWPDAPWLRARGAANGKFTNANEHLADAMAIITAGVRTTEFAPILQFIRTQRALAA